VSTGEGSTSQSGSYTVIGCFIDVSYLTTGFFISSPTVSGVPQFPLGTVALFSLAIPALLVIRRRVRTFQPAALA
jgi:hypothetical protein